MEVIAILFVIALGIATWKIGKWIDAGFDQLEKDRNEALDHEERRRKVFKSLGDWLDRH